MATIKKIQGPATFQMELSQEEVNYLTGVLASTTVDGREFPDIRAIDKHLFRLLFDNTSSIEYVFDGHLTFKKVWHED